MRNNLRLPDFAQYISAADREKFANKVQRVHANKGQVVIGQRERNFDVYFIVSGRCRVTVYSANGREVILRDLGDGDMFGELAALGIGQRTASVVAVSKCELLRLSGDDFKDYVTRSPNAALWIVERLSGQVAALTERVFELSALNVRSRIHAEILRFAILAGIEGNEAHIAQMPTHKELANRIGTHREAVTKELKSLVHEGIAEAARGALRIKDVAKLTKMVKGPEGEDYQNIGR